ncbi:MAG: RagB/SusD family nutrient uptake outer membrane protein [Bacteroidales bacterium]|nr:RagB/SusD family nutrient uptake outer membrane protein [Bacteroidales bacterium]
MKRIFIFGALALLLAGCSSQLDQIRPKDKISSAAVNEADLSKLTNGILNRMESLTVSFWCDGDYLGENFTAGPGFDYADVHGEIVSSSSSWAKSRWQTGFVAIMHINELLKSANSASAESAATLQAKGTAYFCRAYVYYELVSRFGGVPILTEPSMGVVPISPEADVWAQIIADLHEAEKYLDSVSNVYRPSDEACWALLSKAYLWTGDKAKAIEYADKLINSKFVLSKTSNEFAGMFVAGQSSKEIIFALANKRSSSFLRIFEKMNDTDASFNYSMAEELRTDLFADKNGTGDIRKDPTYNPAFPVRIIKFPNGGQNMGQFIANEDPSASPIMVFRLADAYLTKAEAQGASAGLATMKTFMESRYASVNLPSSMGDKEFQNLVLDENNREFYAEGRRWFDIKRTKRTDLYKTWNGRDHLLYWPIPQDEIDLVGKEAYPQNPGY